jgi:hypothetical protein
LIHNYKLLLDSHKLSGNKIICLQHTYISLLQIIVSAGRANCVLSNNELTFRCGQYLATFNILKYEHYEDSTFPCKESGIGHEHIDVAVKPFGDSMGFLVQHVRESDTESLTDDLDKFTTFWADLNEDVNKIITVSYSQYSVMF